MSSFKMTEQSLRQPLLIGLTQRLKSHGFEVVNELSYKFRGKVMRIPDIVILREGKFTKGDDALQVEPGGIAALIETKRMNIAKGMAQVSQYQSQIRQTVGPARIISSTTFDEIWLHDELSGNYELQAVKGVKRLTDMVSDVIIKGLGFTPKEYTDAEYAQFLQAAVEQLTPFTRQIPSDILDHLTGIFLALALDAEITKDPEAVAEVNNTASRAAAFILVNQLFFYHLLSAQPHSAFRPLETLVSLTDVQKALDGVLKKDFTSIFSAKLLPLLPEQAEDAVNGIIEQLRLLHIETRSNDIIGKVFHSLIPPKLRKRIAAYYTGNPAARLLGVVCIQDRDAIVADLACGSGTMLVEAYKRKRELFGDYIPPCEIHDKLLGELYGIDICMFSGQLAAMNLFIQDLACFPKRINIAIDDAFHVASGSQEVLALEEAFRTDFIQTGGKMRLPRFFDCIMINPPFTDRRRMTKDYVKSIDRRMRSIRKLNYVSGQFHLGLYFILHCESFLKDGGFLGVVIPESILQNVSTNRIKDFILRRFRVFAFVSSEAQVAFSEDTDWKEILLILRKGKARSSDRANVVLLKEKLTYENALAIGHSISQGSVPTSLIHTMSIGSVSHETLAKSQDWVQLLRRDEALEEIEREAKHILKTGQEIFYQRI